MTADAPYDLDFFTEITDVHFGTAWIIVNGGGQDPFTNGWIGSADFPGSAGGTPGLALCNVLAPNSAFHPSPPGGPGTYKVTQADLTGKLATQAGAALTGFGIGVVPPIQQAGGYGILSLNRLLPSGAPFKVRMRSQLAGGGGFSANVQVWITKKITAGQTLAQILAAIPSTGFATGNIPGIGTQDFTVNPTKLTVTLG